MHGDVATLLPLGTTTFHVLLVLAADECHGYSISKKVEAATNGAILLRPGRLYSLLKQMLADGWISEVQRADPSDPRRRYYRLTPWGRRIAQAEAERLENLLKVARACNLLPALA